MARQSNGAPPKVSIISEETTFEGTLISSSDMSISGCVKGSLETAGKLVIPEGGYIEGSVKAASGDIAGRIKGSVNVSGSLLLKRTAVVDANIQIGRLMVEEGAIFNGECRTGDRIIDTSEIPVSPEETDNSEPAHE